MGSNPIASINYLILKRFSEFESQVQYFICQNSQKVKALRSYRNIYRFKSYFWHYNVRFGILLTQP